MHKTYLRCPVYDVGTELFKSIYKHIKNKIMPGPESEVKSRNILFDYLKNIFRR